VVTTSPFAIILAALESPCKALEDNVGRLFIKTLVCC
jgi:arginine/lysine/ornithine decarboxylase